MAAEHKRSNLNELWNYRNSSVCILWNDFEILLGSDTKCAKQT